MRWKEARRTLMITVVVASAASARVFAQIPSPSTRALGMGDNYTAAGSGYSAVAWNPALLGLTDVSSSLAIFPVRGVAGLTPIGLTDLSEWQGTTVPAAVREGWLSRIEGNGREAGSAGGDATYVAAHIGRVGFQLSSSLRAVGDLTPGAAELLFFGNAGRTGEPRDLTVGGSEFRAHAISTAALSYALPLRTSGERHSAIGATVKYTIGHMLMLGHAAGKSIAAEPAIDLAFPIVATSSDLNVRAGAGASVDLAFATRRGAVTFGANLRNALSAFSWDASRLEFREGLAQFDQASKATDFDAYAFASAPADLKRAVADAHFARAVAAGVAINMSPRFMISNDLHIRLERTTLADQSSFHLGSGAEYQIAPALFLRAGATVLENGYQFSGGFGWKLGLANVAASVARRNTGFGSGTITMITLFSTLAD